MPAADCCDFDQPRPWAAAGSVLLPKIAPLPFPRAMDLRLLLVATPIVLAAAWAVFHIGRAAVGQLQLMIKRAQA